MLVVGATWYAPCIKSERELQKKVEEFNALDIELVFLYEKNSKKNDKYLSKDFRSFIVQTKGKKPKENLLEIGEKLCPLEAYWKTWPLNHFFLVDKNMKPLLHYNSPNDKVDIIVRLKELDMEI